MTNLVMIGLFLMLFLGGSSQERIQEIRELYEKAAGGEEYARELVEIAGSVEKTESPLIYGYYGAANMMMAKHVGNPFSKISYFKDGKKVLEEAIELDSENVELRFLRFSVQSEAPGFLGYNSDIEKDKEFLLQYFDAIRDDQLKEIIRSFLLTSTKLSKNEKREL